MAHLHLCMTSTTVVLIVVQFNSTIHVSKKSFVNKPVRTHSYLYCFAQEGDRGLFGSISTAIPCSRQAARTYGEFVCMAEDRCATACCTVCTPGPCFWDSYCCATHETSLQVRWCGGAVVLRGTADVQALVLLRMIRMRKVHTYFQLGKQVGGQWPGTTNTRRVGVVFVHPTS